MNKTLSRLEFDVTVYKKAGGITTTYRNTVTYKNLVEKAHLNSAYSYQILFNTSNFLM